jgi:hypothetical protein
MLRQYVENLEHVKDKPLIINNTATVQQRQDVSIVLLGQQWQDRRQYPPRENQISGAEARESPQASQSTLFTP